MVNLTYQTYLPTYQINFNSIEVQPLGKCFNIRKKKKCLAWPSRPPLRFSSYFCLVKTTYERETILNSDSLSNDFLKTFFKSFLRKIHLHWHSTLLYSLYARLVFVWSISGSCKCYFVKIRIITTIPIWTLFFFRSREQFSKRDRAHEILPKVLLATILWPIFLEAN